VWGGEDGLDTADLHENAETSVPLLQDGEEDNLVAAAQFQLARVLLPQNSGPRLDGTDIKKEENHDCNVEVVPQHCNEYLNYLFPAIKMRGLSPYSYIHVSVSDLHIPSIDLPIW
jgi:hypothetical protein